MNTIDSILGFLALSSALVFAALVIFNNDYNRWSSSRVVISGLVAMVLVLANIVFSSHTEWRLKSKEVARVHMNQTQGFQFKYVSIQGKQIPLLNGEYKPYKKLLDKWNVDFKPGVFERLPNDTVYCYYLEQYKMGVATGDIKLSVDTAPMPDYEFTLFYEQNTTGTQILPDSLVQ